MVLQIGAAPYYIRADQAEKSTAAALGAIGVERSWNYKMKYLKEAFPDIKDIL
jgi:hypothetical protein